MNNSLRNGTKKENIATDSGNQAQRARGIKWYLQIAALLLLSLAGTNDALATTYYNIAGTALNTASNWSTDGTGGGTLATNFSTNGDVFNLDNAPGTWGAWTLGSAGNAVTLNINYTGATISVTGAFSASNGSSVNIASGVTVSRAAAITFNVNGNFTIDGTYSGSTGLTTVAGACAIGATGTYTVTGNGGLTNSAGTFTNNGIYASTSGAISTTSFTNNGTFTVTTGALTVTGDWTNSGTYTVTTGNLSISGNWSNTGTYTNGANTVTFNATTTGKTISGNLTGTSDFSSVTFNGVGGEWAFSNDAELSAALTITNGTVIAPAGSLKIGTNFVRGAGGTFTHNSGTVELDGTAAQAIPTLATTFNNITISNTAASVTFTAGVTTTISGTLTVNNNTSTNPLIPGSAATVITGGTLAGSGNIRVTATGANALTSQYAFTTYDLSNLAVDYNSTSDQTVEAAVSPFRGVTLQGTGSNKTFDGGITASSFMTILTATVTAPASPSVLSVGAFTITSGTFDANGATLNVSSNFVHTAGTFNANGGTVHLNGSGAQTISGATLTTFDNLTIDNGSSRTITLSQNITVNNNFTNPTGITLSHAAIPQNFNADFTNNGTYAGTTAVGVTTIGGNLVNAGTYTVTSAPTNVTGNVTNDGTYAATTGGMTVGGNLTNSGTGTYTVTTGAATVTGDISNAGTFSASGIATITAGSNFSNTNSMSIGASIVSFTATSTGKTIGLSGGTNTVGSFVFAGSGGEWTFNDNATLNGSLTTVAGASVIAPATLTIAGSLTNAGTFTAPSGTLSIATSYSNSGTFTHNSGTVAFTSAVAGRTLAGTMTGASAFNNLTFSGTTPGAWSFGANAADVLGTFTQSGTGTVTAPSTTLKVTGDFVHSAGTFTHNSGTVQLDGPGAQTIGGASATTFNTLTIDNNARTVSATGAGTITVNTAFTIPGNVTLSAGTTPFAFANDYTNNGTFTCGTGTVSFTGATGTLNGNLTGTSKFNNLTFSNAAGVYSFGATDAEADGNFTLTNATSLTAPSGTLKVGGNFVRTAGIFTHNSGTVELDGTAAQVFPSTTGVTFNNVLISNNSASTTFNASTTIVGTLTVNSGAFPLLPTANTTVITGTGGTLAGTGEIRVTATSATALTTQYNFTTFNMGSLTVDFNSNTAQSIAATATVGAYGGLKINTTTTGVKTLLGDITVNGNVSITSTTETTALVDGGFTISVGGNWTQTSSTAVANFSGTGTVDFTGAAAKTISIGGGLVLPTFASLTNSGSGTLTIVPATYSVSGNYANTGGGIIDNTTNNTTVTFNSGATGRTLSGTLTGTSAFNNVVFTNAAGGWTFSNDADIEGNLTLTNSAGAGLALGSSTVNIDGNFTHTAGTFNAGSGTVNLDGDYSHAAGTFTGGTSTFNLTGAGAQSIGGAAATAFNALAIANGTRTVTATGAGLITAGAAFTIPVDVTLSTATTNLAFGDDYTNNGAFTCGTATVSFTGTSGVITGNVTGNNKFNNLTFSNAAGNWSFAATDADVQGNFTITTAGSTVTAPSGTLKVGGNFVKTAGTFTHNNGTVELNGTGAQTIPTSAITFYNLTNSNSATSPTGVSYTNGVTTTVANTLTNDGLLIAGGTTAVLNGGGTGTLTGSGTLRIVAGTFAANATNFATTNLTGMTVDYNTNTTAQAVSSTVGSYGNLILTGTTSTKTAAGTITVLGDITLATTTGAFALGANTVNIGGTWSNNSTGAANVTGASSTVNFNGTGAQVIQGSNSNPTPFANLTNSNTTNPLSVTVNTNVSGTLSVVASATVTPTAGAQFNSGAAAGTISGSGEIDVTRIAATADYSNQYKFTTNTLSALTVDYTGAGDQGVNSFTYGTLKTSNTGTKTAQGNVTVNTALNVANGTTLDMDAAHLLVAGTSPTYTVDGTLKTSVPTSTSATPIPSGATWNGTGTVEYGALTGSQTVVSGTYNNLTLDNTSGTNATGGTITANGTLTLGNLTLGANNVVLGTAASIAGASASNYVIATSTGKLRKMYSANGSFAYPIGDASNYSPISLSVAGSGYTSAYAEANVTAAKHPNNANTNNYINRYWTVNTSGISGQSYDATATYVAGDVVGSDASMAAGQYVGSLPWVQFGNANTGAKTLTATAIDDAASDFSGVSASSLSIVTSGDVTICSGESTTLSAAGTTGDPVLTYSWAPNTNLSATTGVSVVASPTTTVVYTLTVTDGNGISNTATIQVSVNPTPQITGNQYLCIGTETTLGTDIAGGTWASSDLAIATVGSSTGVVTGVDAGTSNITYELATGCTAIATVTVNEVPTSITGSTQICGAGTTTLSVAEPGGTWSSQFDTVATVNISTGVVTSTGLGQTTITYTINTGCSVSTVVTVNPVPAPISTIGGVFTACTGFTKTLSSSTGGGTWSSSNLAVGTIGTTGIVSGLTAGNTTITYTLATGCYRTQVVTVNQSPAAITGASAVCATFSITLNDADAGGTWTSSAPVTATVGSATGIVTGVGGGATTISYTLPNGCSALKSVTGNSLPVGITGTASVCEGLTATLTNGTAGGTWSGSDDAIATIGSSTGILTGVLAGNNTATYTIISTGCYRTITVTVNQTPGAITGNTPVCSGSTITLGNSLGGGTWLSSNGAIVQVGSSSGIVTGSNTGNANVTYRIPSTLCRAVAQVTVNAAPNAITGSSSVCEGLTITLACSTPSGNWSSSNSSIASVGTSGIVTGVAGGVATITYTVGTGCYVTKAVSVNTFASITGTLSACVGLTSTLDNAMSGGTWTSSNTSIATVGSASGVVTAITAGTATISYTLATGCRVSSVFTVNPSNPITGTNTLCEGREVTLSSTPGGGDWTSSNTSVATVGSATGIVAGVLAGTSMITYTLGTGCFQTYVVTINASPDVITGPSSLCYGNSITLANAVAGGDWSSSNTTVATIGSATGIVSTGADGTTTISYTLGNGCASSTVITVNPLPQGITGTLTVCEGATTQLESATAGGDWTSSATGVATVGSATGVVSGVAAGNATISYTLSTGCYRAAEVTVNESPAAITGMAEVCEGASITLDNAVAGGTWMTANAAIAAIGSSTGILTGGTEGNTMVTYTVNGCIATAEATVNAQPSVISGSAAVCEGTTTTLGNAVAGGSWTSSTPSAATIGSASGIVSGILAGNTMITYSLGTSCIATKEVTVNASPTLITGTLEICAGATSSLGVDAVGGTWSSSNLPVATIGSATGVLTGVAAGTAVVTYTVSAGCRITAIATINALPAAISGQGIVCEGNNITLTSTTSGGTWTSSNTSAGTVGSATGIVTGVAAGNTTISYSLSTGCMRTHAVTVNDMPAAITGPSAVCFSYTITLANADAGGTWTSSIPASATVGSATGIVTGTGGGAVNISYSLSGGCAAVKTITVNSLPQGITGAGTVCEGATTVLADATSGGTWVSSDDGTATVGSTTGIVTGVAAGNATISYVLSSTGCYRTTIATVNPTPAAITGNAAFCSGATITLANADAGGTWSSSAVGVATVGTSSGIASGVGAGNATITYRLATGCRATAVVTVNTQPAAIAGASVLCDGGTVTLTNSTGGGSWISSDDDVATIGSATGIVNGIAAGNATMTYTLGTSCISTKVISVNTTPTLITGTAVACVGNTSTLEGDVPGGTWSTNNAGVATIGSASGIFTGVAAGTANMTYTVGAGCYIIKVVTINTTPSPFSGSLNICAGYTTTITSTPTGGTWASSVPGVATIGSATGIATGVAAGNTIITYTSAAGCVRTNTMTINASPAAITGPSTVCFSYSITLEDADAGGTWTSSSPAAATVGSATGIVTAVGGGAVNISYTLGGGCYAVKTVTINTLPQGITGTASVCEGATTALADATSGGTWISSATGTATVGSVTGIVSGVAAGNATISYVLSATGCYRTTTVTVNPTPAAITGNVSFCGGSTITLADADAGGTWSSSSVGVATVGTSSGIVSGVGAGNATITYRFATGCRATTVVTVNTQPAAITGSSVLCDAGTITLANSTAGGSWISSNTSAATIGSATGIVSGVAAGNTTITYTLGTACISTKVLTVNVTPTTIDGTAAVCVGFTSTLEGDVPGGTWSSNNTGVATIGSASGIFTGVAAGTARMTYTVGSGCYITTVVTINGLPSPINGTKVMCSGYATTLSSSPATGVWTSASTGIATVGSATGIVSGVSAGTSNITYTLPTGCLRATVVTVNQSPAAITGPSAVCNTYSITLANADAGGTWTSSIPTSATVGSATGIVTGIGGSAVYISYTLPGGCSAVKTVTLNPLPYGITGTLSVCEGANTTLANYTSGGTWSSNATGTASVGSTSGVVTGVVAGNANITYTITSTGCYRAVNVTVNETPTAITGNAPLCTGSTMTLGDAVAGGTWSMNGGSIAAIGSATGIVTGGTSSGAVNVTYKLANTCKTISVVTVNPTPNAITGASRVCVASTITLSSSAGGAWSSTTPAAATVGTSGIVTGAGAGTTTISYTVASTGCYRTKVVTVSATPGAGSITGASTVTAGSTITLANAETGGAWSSNSGGIATVNSSTGVVSGVAPGNATITYTLNNGCGNATTTHTVTVTGGGKAAPGSGSGVADLDEVHTSINEVLVFPNPNKGDFTIKGAITSSDDVAVAIEVTDMVGKVIYQSEVTAVNGKLNEKISLQNGISNGMYMLILKTGTESKTFHFAINE